ncbi:MAG: PQQ-binding-like beta-propeller repeat protein [Phycisphaerales bacterium]|nr:PQQ-binding-like beta-propeller repeat protein [Planctomycetota bacterium]
MLSWAGIKGSTRTLLLSGVLAALLAADRGFAQSTPVYPDDSVQARETIARVEELIAAGNIAETVRVLQALLETEGERVLETKADSDVFTSVREHIHKLLLERPTVLERYRAAESPRAAKLLEEGKFADVERTRLLTPAGLDATVRLAQSRYEQAKFEAARLTLFQLEEHPDRKSGKQGARDAAALAVRLARFLPREDVRGVAQRWCKEAGVSPEAITPIEWPAGVTAAVRSTMNGNSAPDWNALPAEPLVSSTLAQRATRDSDSEEQAEIFEAARQSASRAWIIPTVVGDTVLINNGSEITGFDRFTLSPLWVLRPTDNSRADARRDSRGGPPLTRLEDDAWIVVGGSVGVAGTGYVTESGREGDRRLHAFEVSSGRALWSVDPATLDRKLEGCSVRGEPVVSEGMLVVPMRRNSSVRRVSGALLAGIDLWSGELRWVRPLCSVGVPAFSRAARTAERAIAFEGVVYRTDSLGVVSAVEAETGRPVWVRRTSPPTDMRAFSAFSLQSPNQPWAASQPIVDGNSLIVLAPDSSAVLRLSAVDGTLLGRRPIEEMGENNTPPSYLLRCGDRLLVVTHDRVLSLALSDFERSPVRASAEFREPMMSGRVIPADSRVLVPLEDRIAELDASDMRTVATHTFPKAGNMVSLPDGILVADAMELHAFIRWETAEAILSHRIESSPDDPSPALSMANLAFRAGRYPRIAPAVDRVLDVRDRSPDSASSQTARKRLIESLRNMLAAGKQRWDPATDSRMLNSGSRIPPVAVLVDLAQRFARAAESPSELAEYELAMGWLGEARSSPNASIEAYGRLLSDDSLADAQVLGDFGVPARASEIATDRLLLMLRRLGPEAYSAFAAQAARELSELGDRASPAELASLGSRFPASSAAAAAWVRLADINEKAGRRSAAARSLALALRALEFAASSRTADNADQTRRLALRLADLLAKLDRPSEAARVIDELNRRVPGANASYPSPVADRLAAPDRRPRFGDKVEGNPSALVGWTVATPKIADGEGRPTDRVMLISAGRRQVGLFATSIVDNRLRPLWTRTYEQRQPRVIRLDQNATYLYWPAESRQDRTGGVLERVRPDGSSAWITREIVAVLDEIEPRTPDELASFATPLDGAVSPGDLLVAMDQNTLVLIERAGRIVSLDLETGKPLWTTKLAGTRVYDGAISAGVLLLGGASSERVDVPVPGRGGNNPLHFLALDARTGGPAKDLRPLLNKAMALPDPKTARPSPGERQQIRWLRSLGSGRFLVGLYDRVVCVDVPNDNALWSFDKASVNRSAECWVLGDRAFVLGGEDRTIAVISLADGTAPFAELETQNRLRDEVMVSASLLPEGQVAFATTHGLIVFGRDGKLVGKDNGALSRDNPQLFAMGSDKVAMMPDTPTADADGSDLRILSLPGGKLLSSRPLMLSRTLSGLNAIDGRLLVSAGGVTIVLPVPAESESLVP